MVREISLYEEVNYCFLGERIMKNITDKKKALTCLEENKMLFFWENLSEELQNDPELIFAYARKWVTTAYREKREFFRSSRENMKELMKTNISLDLLEEEDLEDTEYMQIAIMSHPIRLMELFESGHKEVLKRAIDKEMALYLVRESGMNLGCLSAFQNDEDIVYEAICDDVRAIQYASPRIQCFFGDTFFVDELKFKVSTHFIKERMEQLEQLQTKMGALVLHNDALCYLMQEMHLLTEKIKDEFREIENAKQKVKQKMQDGIISYRGEILYKK